MKQKILFIDRDGTLIVEPEDKKIDRLDKLEFIPGVIAALLSLQQAGFTLVMVTNQDSLGTPKFSQQDFDVPHQFMMAVFSSQGIQFEAVRVCPHSEADGCACRKPRVGLVLDYLSAQIIDIPCSYVIGDRETDKQLAENMGIKGIRIGEPGFETWAQISAKILNQARTATVVRETQETRVTTCVNLDDPQPQTIDTGIAFFDHMLAQLAKHGMFGLQLCIKGDLKVDDHHTVEDAALCIGQAINQALGDKRGIGRYGFVLPMDEALAAVSLDVCGRPYFNFSGNIPREKVGELSTECVSHFFRSLAQSLGAALHITVNGENAHHMIEAAFKAVGRCLQQAIRLDDNKHIPSTKGVL